MNSTVAAIDFGTSKIVTLVADHGANQRCNIIGAGIVEYDGFLEDNWNDPVHLNEQIRLSIQDAEKQSHRKIKEIIVGIPAAYTSVYVTEVHLELKGTEPSVTMKDVTAIFAKARERMERDQVQGIVLHSTPAWFKVDNSNPTLEPVGRKGRNLTALISCVVASNFIISDLKKRMDELGIVIRTAYSSAVGEAQLCLTDDERKHTAVLIDMGYLCTDLMVMEGDALIFLKTINQGGADIAVDLAMELDIDLEMAEEKIKQKYAFGLSTAEDVYEVPAMDGNRSMTFTHEQVSSIINNRVSAIAGEIQNELKDNNIRLGSWSAFCLTGGGLAMNRGGKDYLSGCLGRAVKEPDKRTTRMNSFTYSSAMGLINLAVSTMEQKQQPAPGFLGAVRSFFRDLLG